MMRLLPVRRAFVEKMLAIHPKAESLKRDGAPLGTYARHFYDLFQLAARPEVFDMLRSEEYAQLKAASVIRTLRHVKSRFGKLPPGSNLCEPRSSGTAAESDTPVIWRIADDPSK